MVQHLRKKKQKNNWIEVPEKNVNGGKYNRSDNTAKLILETTGETKREEPRTLTCILLGSLWKVHTMDVTEHTLPHSDFFC